MTFHTREGSIMTASDCGLWAAHCRVASDCPRPSLLCNAYAAAGCALSSSHPTVQAFCFLCGAYAAVGCALSSSHPTTQAFRFPCSACAAVGCALPCCIRLPKTFVALQCMIFFSIGLLVLIGLCFFYRLETSAPGLSGYYWYIFPIGTVGFPASVGVIWKS